MSKFFSLFIQIMEVFSSAVSQLTDVNEKYVPELKYAAYVSNASQYSVIVEFDNKLYHEDEGLSDLDLKLALD